MREVRGLRPIAEPQAAKCGRASWATSAPVQSFNIGKKGEYNERQMFSEDAADTHGELVSAFPPAGSR